MIGDPPPAFNEEQTTRGAAIMLAKEALMGVGGLFAGTANKATPADLIAVAEYIVGPAEPDWDDPCPYALVEPPAIVGFDVPSGHLVFAHRSIEGRLSFIPTAPPELPRYIHFV